MVGARHDLFLGLAPHPNPLPEGEDFSGANARVCDRPSLLYTSLWYDDSEKQLQLRAFPLSSLAVVSAAIVVRRSLPLRFAPSQKVQAKLTFYLCADTILLPILRVYTPYAPSPSGRGLG